MFSSTLCIEIKIQLNINEFVIQYMNERMNESPGHGREFAFKLLICRMHSFYEDVIQTIYINISVDLSQIPVIF